MQDEIKWVALEYKQVPKSNDWYWAVGITAFALAVGSILQKLFVCNIYNTFYYSYFLFFKKTTRHTRSQNKQKGVFIGELLYPTDSIKNFWIHHSEGDARLLLLSSRLFDPIISVYIDEDLEDEIREFLSRKIPEKQIQEPKHRLIMERLGF